MSDVPRAVSLTCTNCGAKLKVPADLDRLACAHCGVEHLVRRDEGVVALTRVQEAIGKVQRSVDRSAAELALARLQREAAAAQAAHDQAVYQIQVELGGQPELLRKKAKERSKAVFLVTLVGSIVLGWQLDAAWLVWVGFGVTALASYGTYRLHAGQAERMEKAAADAVRRRQMELDELLTDLGQKIERQRAIAEGR